MADAKTMRRTEDEARQKALDRLNYERLLRKPVWHRLAGSAREKKENAVTIINAVTIHPRSGEVWDDVLKQIKKSTDIMTKHGAGEVRTAVVAIGGGQTNDVVLVSEAENWAEFGKIQDAVYGDPEMQALLAEAGKIATWEIVTAQTLEL
jgi:hypothetical protein